MCRYEQKCRIDKGEWYSRHQTIASLQTENFSLIKKLGKRIGMDD